MEWLVFNGQENHGFVERTVMPFWVECHLRDKVSHTGKHSHYFKSSSLANGNIINIETLDFFLTSIAQYVCLLITYGSKFNTQLCHYLSHLNVPEQILAKFQPIFLMTLLKYF